MMSVFAVCSPDVPVIAAPYLFGFFWFLWFSASTYHSIFSAYILMCHVYSVHVYYFDVSQCIQCMYTISISRVTICSVHVYYFVANH